MSKSTAAVWPAIAAVAVLFLGITSVVNVRQSSGDVQLAGAAGGDAAVAPTALTVDESEFAITPADLQAPAGSAISITAVNVGQAEHNLVLVDGAGTPNIAPGEEAVLELGALEAGSYELICDLPGHADAGMRASLTVVEGGQAPTTPTGAVATEDHDDHSDLTPEEMVAGHVEGVQQFVAAATGEIEPLTEGKGNQLLEPEMDGDVKVFELTADEIEWEVAPGDVKQGMAFNGQIPGPRIEVEQGDEIRIVVHNELEVPTGLHPHGQYVPNAMDGVPGLTQDAIMPGESFTYEWTVRNSGSHMYHSHFDSAKQVPSGLLGALIVHGPDDIKQADDVDLDYTMILNDGPLGYTINGKGFPATEAVIVPEGETVRVRYMNEGLQIHPMHLHGIEQLVVAKDGYPLPQPHTEDTVLVAPGERVDVLVRATEPGAWAFHCHILNHAEAANGMFGMVTAMVVQ